MGAQKVKEKRLYRLDVLRYEETKADAALQKAVQEILEKGAAPQQSDPHFLSYLQSEHTPPKGEQGGGGDKRGDLLGEFLALRWERRQHVFPGLFLAFP